MKKIVLMAFAALSLSAMAQQVTPVTIQLTSVNLDSLRTLYMTEPIMYRASLEALSQALEKNAEELKAAKAEREVEQAHAKEMGASLKEATKTMASMKKLYSKEEAELKSMQKTIEKQQKTLNKQKELNAETRDSYTQILNKQQKELGYSLREIADRQRAVSDIETTLQNGQSKISLYEQQTIQKAGQLATIEAQLKERITAVKAEQKSAKNMQ